MIDMHIHCVPPNLPGVGPLHPVLEESVEDVAFALKEQMLAGGVEMAFAMGCLSDARSDPLGIERTLKIGELVPNLRAIGVANPTRTDEAHLREVEKLLAARRVAALKGYLGYLPFYPHDAGYRPYLELAARYDLPFIFHTGDTFSPLAKLKYAHPLEVDEVAVDWPKVRFVMAHVGNPWMIDAAEVVFKNLNVWADLSGLIVGAEQELGAPEARLAIDELIERTRAAFQYAERPNRFLYGSDWPLAPMPFYSDIIRRAIPQEHHENVFVENARKLFGLKR